LEGGKSIVVSEDDIDEAWGALMYADPELEKGRERLREIQKCRVY
jgi:hypothetical protein